MILFLLIFVLWRDDGPRYSDTLEMSSNLISWVSVPKPYQTTNGDWRVAITNTQPKLFFRVKRVWSTNT